MPGTSTEQVVDKGIRQKSIRSFHSIHSFPDGSAFCPWGTEACSLGLRETPACMHVIQRLSQPRVACWHGFRHDSQKTECVFTRCPTCGRKKLRVYTASEAKGLTPNYKLFVINTSLIWHEPLLRAVSSGKWVADVWSDMSWLIICVHV